MAVWVALTGAGLWVTVSQMCVMQRPELCLCVYQSVSTQDSWGKKCLRRQLCVSLGKRWSLKELATKWTEFQAVSREVLEAGGWQKPVVGSNQRWENSRPVTVCTECLNWVMGGIFTVSVSASVFVSVSVCVCACACLCLCLCLSVSVSVVVCGCLFANSVCTSARVELQDFRGLYVLLTPIRSSKDTVWSMCVSSATGGNPVMNIFPLNYFHPDPTEKGTGGGIVLVPGTVFSLCGHLCASHVYMCVLCVCQGETLYLELKFYLKFPSSEQPIFKCHQWGYVAQQSGNLRRSLSPAPFCCRYATIRENNFESHHKYIIWVHKYVVFIFLNTPVRHMSFDSHCDAVFCRIWSFNSACTLLLAC